MIILSLQIHTQIQANLQDPKTGRQSAKTDIIFIHTLACTHTDTCTYTRMHAHTHFQVLENLQDPKTGRQLTKKQTQSSINAHTQALALTHTNTQILVTINDRLL